MTMYRVQAQWGEEVPIAVHFPDASEEAGRLAEALFEAGYRVSMSEHESLEWAEP